MNLTHKKLFLLNLTSSAVHNVTTYLCKHENRVCYKLKTFHSGTSIVRLRTLASKLTSKTAVYVSLYIFSEVHKNVNLLRITTVLYTTRTLRRTWEHLQQYARRTCQNCFLLKRTGILGQTTSAIAQHVASSWNRPLCL